MSKDTMNGAPDGQPPAKPKGAKPRISKSRISKPATTQPKLTKPKSKLSTKAAGSAPTKAAVKKAAKADDKTATKAATKPKAPAKQARTEATSKPTKTTAQPKLRSTEPHPSDKPRRSDKPHTSDKAVSQEQASALAVPSLGQSFQAAVPVAVAVNTKLLDIAQENVSAGLELARGLAGAKSPMEAMQLGVAFWFNHIGAVQTQTRELQSLSAVWVRTASEQTRAS